MNVGWYVVYCLMIIANQVLCYTQGFDIGAWQNWLWSAFLILCFVAGSYYRKET